MARLSELDNTIRNAIHVLGKPTLRRWQVFEKVNGKLVGPEIAKLLKKQPTHMANDLTLLHKKGLIEPVGKRGKAVIYAKIPELHSTNLRSYVKYVKEKKPFIQIREGVETTKVDYSKVVLGKSRAVERILSIGKKFGIENINQNWVDSLVILNFIETAATKFLMDHGYTEQQVKKMHWEDKISKLEAKLYEEASKRGVRPRTSVLTVLKNYRTQRNDLDHEAHIADAKIQKHEVELLLKTLNVFVKQIFEEHRQYCSLE